MMLTMILRENYMYQKQKGFKEFVRFSYGNSNKKLSHHGNVSIRLVPV